MVVSAFHCVHSRCLIVSRLKISYEKARRGMIISSAWHRDILTNQGAERAEAVSQPIQCPYNASQLPCNDGTASRSRMGYEVGKGGRRGGAGGRDRTITVASLTAL